MKCFVDLSPARQDETRIYWLLVIEGPLMMRQIRELTGWSCYRANAVLYRLRRHGLAQLIEKGQHYHRHTNRYGPLRGANRCGKWQAIADCEVGEIVEAEIA